MTVTHLFHQHCITHQNRTNSVFIRYSNCSCDGNRKL